MAHGVPHREGFSSLGGPWCAHGEAYSICGLWRAPQRRLLYMGGPWCALWKSLLYV